MRPPVKLKVSKTAVKTEQKMYCRLWDTSSSDLPIEFPVQSIKGYSHMLMTTYRNFIHAEPMKDKTAASYKAAYTRTFHFFRPKGHQPKLRILDNERSELVHE